MADYAILHTHPTHRETLAIVCVCADQIDGDSTCSDTVSLAEEKQSCLQNDYLSLMPLTRVLGKLYNELRLVATMSP